MLGVARQLAEALGELVVHPEAALEVDLAGACSRARASSSTAASGLSRDGTRAGPKRIRVIGWHASGAATGRPGTPSDRGLYAVFMAKRPSRIDLLELDIDLRLADLWREAADISEWNLEVVAAFMRAAYGKGYCDALTEERPARSATTTATACRRGAPRRRRR